MGAPLFSSLILPTVVAEQRLPTVRLGRRLAALVVTLSLLVLAALAADMIYQVAALDGSTPLAALGDLALVPQVVATTGYGIYWAVKVVAALALLTYALWRRRTPAPPEWPAAVLNAGFLFAAEALSSHGGASPAVAGLPLGTAIDLLHLLTAGAWIGGLLYLAAVLLPVLRRMDPATASAALGRIMPRFSRLALFSAGLLFVTGLGNLALHTLDPAAVLDSDYGRIVALKHLLFLPLLTLAALSNRLVQPHVPTLLAVEAPGPSAAWPRTLVGAVRAQVALGLLILLLAAGLTLLPPPAAPGSPAAPVELAGAATPAAPALPASASGAQSSGGCALT